MTYSQQITIESSPFALQNKPAPEMRWAAQELISPGAFKHLDFEFDESIGALWCNMSASERPNFHLALLDDLARAQAAVRAGLTHDASGLLPAVRTVVLASRSPGVYNLGGDLGLFADYIRSQDRARLTEYAHRCADIVFNSSEGYGGGVTTVALVQGQALGGGFEAALSCHVIIAERGARLGLPEVMFNLFPGMGAYSFLSRRLSAAAAERLILSGKVYTAEELHGMGLVDVLAEDGEGVAAVRQHVRELDRRPMSRRAMRHVCNAVNPVSRAELIEVTDIWVETALRLCEDDLRRMQRLVAAQDRRRPTPAMVAAE